MCAQLKLGSAWASAQSYQSENRKIAVCFLWLSLPGHYRITDETLLAVTISFLMNGFIALKGTHFLLLFPSLLTWRSTGFLATHWAHSEEWSAWLIRVFAAQADPSLRWAHWSFSLFCHAQAQITNSMKQASNTNK